MNRFFRQLFTLSFCAFVAASFSLAAEEGATVIQGESFTAQFHRGWLVSWQNKKTGETFEFGEPSLPQGADYRHYRPGFWSIDAPTPEDEARQGSAAKFKVDADGADGMTIQQSISGINTRLQALQWGLQVPYKSGLQVHWPRGLAPSRVSGAGFQESLLGADYFFGMRAAALVGTSKLRSNAYFVQGTKGGLLIYMDNADSKHFQAFEFLPMNDPTYKVGAADFRDHLANGLIVSNRSIQPPTAEKNYTGPRWVIRQYPGGIQMGAQLYQDFAVKAYHLTPLSERPTAWVQNLGLVFVNSANALRGPKTIQGKSQPAYDYLSENAWIEGMKEDNAYLERLAKVIDPDKVMFYTTEWAEGGQDTAFPEFNPDPYVAAAIRKARARGFHVMLHMHNSLVQFPTSFTDKYILQSAKYMGLDVEKDHIPGVYYDELRSEYIYQHNKEFGTTWNDRSGQRRVFNAFHMNPACGGWRRLFVNRIVNALAATGADAVHLDVPDWMVDRYNDRYGMNPIEGQLEFYRLLRETLDENGMKKVAISCEVTPNETFMRYVDLAQRSRNTSARSRMQALAEGAALGEENLITLQTGKSLDAILKERKKSPESNAPLDPQKAMGLFKQTSRDLGIPSVDNMVFSNYVQAYPHLGATLPDNPQGYLAAWYWFVNDCIPTGTGGDLSKPISPFYYGVIALGRFRSQEGMRLESPAKWVPGDLADYRLRDGRLLRVFRADDTTLRIQFENNQLLAELDVFKGWKNADLLFKKYGSSLVGLNPR